MSADPLIGIMGRAQAGKDTAADVLVQAGWERVAFADALRAMAYDIDPTVSTRLPGDGVAVVRLSWLVDELGWDAAKQYPDVRRFLQRLGKDGIRDHVATDFWVTKAFGSVRGPTVFTDVRFPNEAEAIRERGGTIIHIVRDTDTTVPNHISETALNGFKPDYRIVNDTTITELHSKIIDIVSVLHPTLTETVY